MNPIVSNGNKLRWKFEDVKNNPERISDIFAIENIDWKMSIRPNKIGTDLFLEITLCCDTKNNDKNWMCEVDAKVKLINQKGYEPDIRSKLKDCYYQDRNKCGIEKFTLWNNLSDGYLSCNYDIIVEVDFSFKYYDFSKTILNFTDIIVNVEDTELHLNKGFLSSKSEYFYDLFVNKNVEDAKITLEDVKAVDFCYMLASFTHGFTANIEGKHLELIKLAKTLGVQPLHYACEQYLLSLTDLGVLDGIKIAEENGYENLMEKCIESLKTPEEVRRIKADDKFAQLEKTTQLRIMFRLLDCV